MSVGFFIWLLFTIVVLGYAWWTARMQMIQKRAWEAFAKKHNLDYTPGKFFETPRFEGFFEGYYIRAYEGEEMDAAGRKKSTVLVELDLPQVFPFLVICAKRSEQAIFQQLEPPQRVRLDVIEGAKWSRHILVGTDEERALRGWINAERQTAIYKSFAVPNTKPLFIAGPDRAFFVLQVDAAMTDPSYIQKLFKRLAESAQVLQLSEVDVKQADEPEDAQSEVPENNEEQKENAPENKTEPAKNEASEEDTEGSAEWDALLNKEEPESKGG